MKDLWKLIKGFCFGTKDEDINYDAAAPDYLRKEITKLKRKLAEKELRINHYKRQLRHG